MRYQHEDEPSVVLLAHARAEVGAVVVKTPNTAATLEAVLGAHRLEDATHAAKFASKGGRGGKRRRQRTGARGGEGGRAGLRREHGVITFLTRVGVVRLGRGVRPGCG